MFSSKYVDDGKSTCNCRCIAREANEEFMKALVVESSRTMRAVLRRLLYMRCFEVAEADNGRQAFDVLSGIGTADLVMVNWTPREADGLEFITRLRHKTAHDSIVIVLATVDSGVRDLQRAFRAGANDYLMKPFTALQIDEKLTRFGLTKHCSGNSDK
jgi:two-component system, chemotaxis family, chemotaxis protein CheY